jgi:hypothetical protein
VTTEASAVDPADYCRQIETYLCRKNEGHLVRIVGPAFEQVCGWAERGVPLKIAFRGIDRYCERYYAKGPQRRPVRIEFCEADVFDAFDEWRRAVGVTGPATGVSFVAEEAPPRRPSLASHIERLIARIIAVRAGGLRSPSFHDAVATSVRELDLIAPRAKSARGDERARILERLAEIDRALIAAARAELDDEAAAQLRREAEAELAPFETRMAPDVRARSVEAAFERLVRDAFALPELTYE